MVRKVIVVAHPDDEILWLSSVMAQADPVVLCFGAPYGKPRKAENRARAVANLGLPRLVDLAVPESGARLQTDWKPTSLTKTGIAISDQAAQKRYEANFSLLLEKLRPILTGATDVYTHNPWGEYGHTEHIQVYRVVKALQAALHFTVWFSNYAAPQTRMLARQLGQEALWQEKQILPTDPQIAHRLRRTYQVNKAWTWSNWHKWPETETLYSQPYEPTKAWHDMKNEILYNVHGLRLWRPTWTTKWQLG